MSIAGFTIIRNAIINDYPVVESIKSILPIVDMMFIGVGESDDETKKLIEDLESEKIKIIFSQWDMSIRKGGRVLAIETDKVFQQIPDSFDWAFYIQADEVVHENDHPAIVSACSRYQNDKKVEGLLFNYFHFYGTYDYIGDSRRWYNKEVRIIRNDKAISAYKDAQGFRKGGKKLNVIEIKVAIYHYGWVKSPDKMKQKMKDVSRFWNEETKDWISYINSEDVFNFDDYDSLELFQGSHPLTIKDRILQRNWHVTLDIKKKKFTLKEQLLYWFEKKTGIRLFQFKNYKILRK